MKRLTRRDLEIHFHVTLTCAPKLIKAALNGRKSGEQIDVVKELTELLCAKFDNDQFGVFQIAPTPGHSFPNIV